jgi:protein transport protein SEC13
MASTLATIDTQHEDMIHDVQPDYYGKRIATCSSDRTIKIFDSNNTQTAELKGHSGPVWQVAWAHPKFGSVLASCSYDKRVFIWKESSPNVWAKIYEYDKHESSVNSVAWAPHEFGLCLVAASSDCSISVLTHKGDNTWEAQRIPQAHAIGVNAVSWAPAVSPGSLISSTQLPAQAKRFVSGGCDNSVKIWRFHEQENAWKPEQTLEHHTDWVRDVAWAPNIGLPFSTIASCSQDGTVVIWTQEWNSPSWTKKVLPKFPDVVWRVSWSVTGNILAVSGGDNKVTLWKESFDNEWKCISQLDEEGEASTN